MMDDGTQNQSIKNTGKYKQNPNETPLSSDNEIVIEFPKFIVIESIEENTLTKMSFYLAEKVYLLQAKALNYKEN